LSIDEVTLRALLQSGFNDSSLQFSPPDTRGLKFAQTGLRYTTSIGSVDIGAQYFYGNRFRPSFTIGGVDRFIDDWISNIPNGNPGLFKPRIEYSRYHQLGVDYAQVLAGFNLRAEFAGHITEDLHGDDGAVSNPFLGWSLGFDRDIIWGINANLQCNETIRLLNDKVGDDPLFDAEADTDMTVTRLTLRVSKKFLRDNLEFKVTNIWGIEDMDCYIIPAITWAIKDLSAELSAGVLTGQAGGELSQYYRNSFIKAGLSYSF
jgi:hypothetical protein